MDTGFHKIADSKYFAFDAVSNSLLKDVHVGGTAWARVKQKTPWVQSASMRIGTALHYAVFDQDEFAQVIKRKKFSGTGSVAAQKEWDAEHSGKLMLSNEDYEKVCRMRDMVLGLCGPFDGGMSEVSAIAGIKGSDMKRKAKIDHLTKDCVWDLKSASSVDINKFRYQARDLHYDMQPAWYIDCAHAVDGIDREFCWVVVKNSDPIDVRIYRASGDDVVAGRHRCNCALDEWHESVKTGIYKPRILPLDIHD